jgi:hypothetical protein
MRTFIHPAGAGYGNATRAREASPNDAAVLQLILNGIGHIGMRRGNSILKAAMLGRIQFERELVALIFVCKAGDKRWWRSRR